MVDVVDEVNHKKFPRQLFRERGLDPKVELSSTKQERAVPLVIVDNGLVIELRRTNPETVVGIGRRQKEAAILEKGADELIILGRRFAKSGLLRAVIEPTRHLGQGAIGKHLS